MAAEVVDIAVPTSFGGWLALLAALWVTIFSLPRVGGAFLARGADAKTRIMFKEREEAAEGYVLPVGWVIWSALLLVSDLTVARVLIVLGGTIGILLAERWRRRFRA